MKFSTNAGENEISFAVIPLVIKCEMKQRNKVTNKMANEFDTVYKDSPEYYSS